MSIDSVFALKEFHEKLQLPFHLISDANRVISRSLGILLPEVAGIKEVTSRAVIFIDPSRQICWNYGGDLNIPDINQVINELNELI